MSTALHEMHVRGRIIEFASIFEPLGAEFSRQPLFPLAKERHFVGAWDTFNDCLGC